MDPDDYVWELADQWLVKHKDYEGTGRLGRIREVRTSVLGSFFIIDEFSVVSLFPLATGHGQWWGGGGPQPWDPETYIYIYIYIPPAP